MMLTFKEYLQKRDPLLYESMLNEASLQDVGNHIKRNIRHYATGLTLAGAPLAGYTAGTIRDLYKYHQLSAMPTSAASKTKADYLYSPDEIVAKVMVTPRELIKNSSDDPERWQRDYDKLQAPENDVGIATHKDKFDKPVLMYVVKPEALARVHPEAGAYADSNHIVMPSNQFEFLPTDNKIGKLTKWGIETLRHELRHKTQKDVATTYFSLPGSVGDEKSDRFKGYMHHPMEMGVRLAAIKNLLSRDNAIKNASGTYGTYAQEFFQELPDDEKSLFDIVTNSQAFKKYLPPNSRWKKNLENEEVAQEIIEDFVKRIKKQNYDAATLLRFIESLPDNEKQSYINQLQQNMDTVVKGDAGLKDRLQQRLANLRGGANTA